MREGLFIKKNVDKWNNYQQVPSSGADETAERFVALIDDLSYAKTFYPHSKLTKWINGLAANVYQSIYKNKKEKYTRIFLFWKFELPLLFKQYHKILLFTFLLFAMFTAIGVFGAVNDGSFVRSVLGNTYVDMTEENIRKGDPFGVYKSDSPFTMFVQIALNNIFISFLMAIGGLLLGIGTLYSMWNNGLMLGCFQHLFFANGLGINSVLVIWIHGTLEILALVLSSTAGFIIANSILFPGTYTRMYSFKKGVKDALKLMIVLVPIFIIAAFFESYITHLMSNTYDTNNKNLGIPWWCSVIILLSSFAFIIWYFVLLPNTLHKKYNAL
jgi:uncharacterized membrane protein SpoIIM required for sporulation